MRARQGTERRLRYGLLGPVAVWRDGTPLELGTPQQQRVLALLVLHRNHFVSTDRLLDALWQDDPPSNALQTVRTYVSRLRGLLGPGEDSPLEKTSAGYRLAVEPGGVDVDRFEVLALEGRRALEAGEVGAACARLEEALVQVRGSPLTGLEYDDFARYEIERLDELRLAVVEDLFDARLLEGRHVELIPELRSAVETHPLRERFWSQLMLALYRSGRQAEALAVYREARDLLDRRLGLEPGRELRDLERMILVQDRALDHDAVGRLHDVPRYVTSFVGREVELPLLRELVRRERLITIVGPAGSGKTRLAAEAASLVRKAFPDGVWWVDLAASTPDVVASSFAEALEIRGDPGLETADLVVSRLRGAGLLLVVDNCEHVSDVAAPLLARILAETPATIVATSREPLRLAGERVSRLAPLSTPPAGEVSPDRVMEYEAARLLVARATMVAGSVTLDEQETRAIAAIVARLDGLPLAIELAAGKLRALSLSELARALEQRVDLLVGGDRSTRERHATLQAAVTWSFQLLSADELRVLQRLSVFPASFDAQAAEAVSADDELPRDAALPVLVQLVEKSLVAAELGDPTRYRLLATVRSFALDSSDDAGELEPAARRHRAYFAAFSDHVFRHMLDAELGTWVPRARLEQANFSAALRSALEGGDGECSLRLASALAAYWFRTGQLREERALLDRALECAGPASRWHARGMAMKAWLSVAVVSPEATADARAAVAACADADRSLLGLALGALADCLIAVGELDEAEHTLRRAREAFAESALGEGSHLTVQLEGELRSRRGDVAGALVRLREARDLYREYRGDLDAGWTLVRLAGVALEAGELEEATTAASEAVEDFRSRGDPRGLAGAFLILGEALTAREEPGHARQVVQEALQLAATWGYSVERERAEAKLRELDAAAV